MTFELPEFAGELRLMAVAWDSRAVGSADAAVKVKRRLVVQPDLPRFLAPGDRSGVEVALHNESGVACTARVSARTEGPLSCDSDVREVALKAGESAALRVPLRWYSLSMSCGWPGSIGNGGRTSAISCFGDSSMHTTG